MRWVAPFTHVCFTPKESSKEIYALTEGYQPSELILRLFDQWDEFGVNYKGVLTYETEGAPSIFHMYYTRATSGHIEKLSP